MPSGIAIRLAMPMDTLTGSGLASDPLFELEDDSGTILLETSGSIQLES